MCIHGIHVSTEALKGECELKDDVDTEELLKVMPMVRTEVRDFRSEFHRAMVISSLIALGGARDAGVTADTIAMDLRDRFGIKSIPLALVVDVFEKLEHEKLIRRRNAGYVLSGAPVPQRDVAKLVVREFEDYLKTKMAGYDPYIHSAYTTAFDAAFQQLAEILGRTTGVDAGLAIESVHVGENRASLVELVRPVLGELDLAQSFVSLFVEYVTSGKPRMSEALFSVYQGAISVDLLARGTELAHAVGQFGTGCRLFMDTNVIVASLCPSNPRHELVIATLQFARSLGFQPVFSPRTQLEFNRLLQAANFEMSTPTFTFRVKEIELVTDFLSREPGTSWFERFVELSNYTSTLKGLYGARSEGLPDVATAEEEDQILRAGLMTVFRVAGRQRSREALFHDLELYKAIQFLRGTIREERPFPEPWVITLDSFLVAFDELQRQQRKAEYGFVMHVRTALAALVPFWDPQVSEVHRGALVVGMMKNLLVPFRYSLTLEEYVKLLALKLGLERKEANVLLKLITLSPLREELVNALREEDPEVLSRTTITALTESKVIDEIVARGKLEREADDLRNRLRGVAERYRTAQAELNAYRKMSARPVVVLVQAGLPPGIPELLLGAVERIKAEHPGALDEAGVSEKDLELGDVGKVRRFVERLEGWINRAGTVAQNLESLVPVLQVVLSNLPKVG